MCTENSLLWSGANRMDTFFNCSHRILERICPFCTEFFKPNHSPTMVLDFGTQTSLSCSSRPPRLHASSVPQQSPQHRHLKRFLRRKTRKLDDPCSTKERGSILLGVVFLWIPIFLMLAVALGLRARGLRNLTVQRDLDRCVHQVVSTRCESLTKISLLNQRLKTLTHAVAVLQTGKVATVLVPGAGAAVMAATQASASTLRAMGQVLARQQDIQTVKIKLGLAQQLRCGTPDLSNALRAGQMQLTRSPTAESQIAQMPAPLEWLGGVQSSSIHVRSKSGPEESFAYCHPDSQESLNGESYEVRFERAAAVKLLSRPSWLSVF